MTIGLSPLLIEIDNKSTIKKSNTSTEADITSHAFMNKLNIYRDFTKALITFPKPVVAVVTGSAVGLGMCMLPLCDIVYASDKATFHLPYSQLAQTPEGGATYSLPSTVGMAMVGLFVMIQDKRKYSRVQTFTNLSDRK